ncbi:hypothetical protein CSUB01_10012 [Colletotrichum sublineola]|uniref:Uncharacterized protein n=1 Tax=Colletotrichum sublineola TaxID=1173701 RepID=A0A066X7J1_COLSU|nr:hypothetical protein CSUB01_10012 [Colletotrichum sublineola]
MLIQARDMKGAKGGEGRVAAFSVICSSTEPYYSGKDKRSEEKTLISFGNLDIAFFDKVQEYMKKHGIQVMLCISLQVEVKVAARSPIHTA